MAEMEFRTMRVDQLRKFLIDRGIPSAGKKKDELVDLAVRAQGKYEVLGDCDHEDSEKKRRRVEDDDGSVTDLYGRDVQWTNDLSNVPSITLGVVFAYLLQHCSWTPERMATYKQDDGYLMFNDQHIETVQYGQIAGHDLQYGYIKGLVKPEQRQTALRYSTWLLVSVHGQIKSAGCGCVAADDGSCKHVVALLFAVENFTTRRLDTGTAVGTDRPCEWTRPRRTSAPVKIEELDYRHNKTTPKKPGPSPQVYKPMKDLGENVISNIQQNLKKVCEESHPGALFLKLITTPAEQSFSVPSIHAIYAEYGQVPRTIGFENFLALQTTTEHLEIMQYMDQSDPAWLEARKMRITASLANAIRTLKDPQNPPRTLKEHVMGTAKPFTSNVIEFGKSNEHVARQLYSIEEGTKHKKFEVKECGLFCMKDAPYIGASPDGLVSCACHDGIKLLEIKCSYKHRNVLPARIPLEDPSYHLELQDGSLSLKKTSAWYSQIIFQMGVTGFRDCDLVIFTQRGIAIIPVKFNLDAWELLFLNSRLLFINTIIPLLGNEE